MKKKFYVVCMIPVIINVGQKFCCVDEHHLKKLEVADLPVSISETSLGGFSYDFLTSNLRGNLAESTLTAQVEL
jgi:hypothetical protein